MPRTASSRSTPITEPAAPPAPPAEDLDALFDRTARAIMIRLVKVIAAPDSSLGEVLDASKELRSLERRWRRRQYILQQEQQRA